MKNIYSVGQLNAYIKNMFTQDYLLQHLYVKGEVSNCKYHSSGHIYFTLKDVKGTISCVMFAGNRAGLSFRISEGQQVIVGGTVDVYERDGKYQLYAKEIMLDGSGLLYEKFEQLKRELLELGMFSQEYKRPIPKYINTLGVVTAATGAAVRDIIQVASRRNPYIQIILYPAIVQGDAAAASIVNGIHALEAMGVDVMIVGRGGGSIEDLWAFNEREVAQAVFDCTVPVISAVGHETDTTIIDYVADMRAPTPSAAAELAVTDMRDILSGLALTAQRLQQGMEQRIRDNRQKLAQKKLRLQLVSPGARIREQKMYALSLEEQLHNRMRGLLQDKRHRMAIYVERMKGLSPLEKLNSGFSYVADEEEKNIRSISQVREGQVLTIHMKDGTARTKVLSTEKARGFRGDKPGER
ncbi:MAG: exodeoxyribonuclease VII large subunit [Lachnospiraceae bacterium]|nr:exodeoxyribonuclease VII large subunit [Lachnospiraceae bacterium]